MNQLHPLEEAPLTQVIHALWKRKAAHIPAGGGTAAAKAKQPNLAGLNIPHTVPYEHNFPKGLYFTSKGQVVKRQGKDIDSQTVVDTMVGRCLTDVVRRHKHGIGKALDGCAPGATLGGPPNLSGEEVDDDEERYPHAIVAQYVEKDSESGLYNVQYFTASGLRDFLLRGVTHVDEEGGGQSIQHVIHKSGMLQRFVYPVGDNNEMIQVVWTTYMCIVEKLRNRFGLSEPQFSTFQRAATFQAPSGFTLKVYVAPTIAERIKTICERIASHITEVEHRQVQRMTLYFKSDENDNVWFLYCGSIKLFKTNEASALEDQERAEVGRQQVVGALPEFICPSAYRQVRTGDMKWNSPKKAKAAHTEELTEEEALEIKHPTIHLTCMESKVGSFVPPTSSKLCPGMRWLKRNSSSKHGLSKSGITQKNETSLFGMSEFLESENAAGSAGRPPTQPAPGMGRSTNKRQKKKNDIDDLRRSQSFDDELPVASIVKYTMATDISDGEEPTETVERLLKQPVNFEISGSSRDKNKEMLAVKNSIHEVLIWADTLAYVLYSRFLQDGCDLSFMIPSSVSFPVVVDTVERFLTGFFRLCEGGNECINHVMEDDVVEIRHGASEVHGCYRSNGLPSITKFKAKLTEFKLVALRTLHSKTEYEMLISIRHELGGDGEDYNTAL